MSQPSNASAPANGEDDTICADHSSKITELEHKAQTHNENLHNDISLEFESRENVYIPREWVTSKLRDIKAKGSLSANTHVVQESVKDGKNVVSFDVVTSSQKTTNFELHLFEGGIIKLNAINPVNPSKFSFEMLDKPANLTPYAAAGKVNVGSKGLEVTLSEAKLKVVVDFAPFVVKIVSINTNTEQVIFEFNANKSLVFDENVTADITVHADALYGLPEGPNNLRIEDTKKALPYRMYSQDVPVYPVRSKNSIYGNVPVIVSRSKNSSTLATLFWQNCSDTYIDFHRREHSTNTFWSSERGNLECYLFVNHSPAEHYRTPTNLLGLTPMPQYWTLGYHQCRWSYMSQKEVLDVNSNFNKYEIPCDSLTLDIDHTDGCRYFTWNLKTFPDPLGLQKALVDDEREVITIADPHIKIDPNYHVYKEVAANGLYIKNKDNEPFIGACWPGESVYVDYLNEEARNNWASQYSYDKYKLSTKNIWAWNDMNEPSVFKLEGSHMPLDNLQTVKTLAEPEKAFQVEHREVHNIYGYSQAKATYDGMIKRDKDQNTRPHVLNRSFFAGAQKWTTIWTGDTGCTWDYLHLTISQLLSLSLCGISGCGGDIGGFFGDPEPELAIRWYQLGTYMPFFRGHSAINTKRREPWLYEKKWCDLIKSSVEERYKMLPYWYTRFEDHCRTGEPILRPIWYDQVTSVEGNNLDEQIRFMVGDSLLVVPIVQPNQSSIKNTNEGLHGRWYDIHTLKETGKGDEINVGLERIGCFIRGGKIVPTFDIKTYVKSSRAARRSSIKLLVALDEQGSSRGTMYADDGESFDFKKGKFARKNFVYENKTFTWKSDAEAGDFDLPNTVAKIVILGGNEKAQNAYLIQEGKNKQKVQLSGEGGALIVEFEAAANKEWSIVLE